jgi:4'-phosphopantetheinyl transferase
MTLATETLDLPARGQVHVWLLSEHSALAPQVQATFESWLSDEECQRWQRFMFPQDRLRFLQARALVRSVLARYLALAPAQLEFTRNAYGKPQLHLPTATPLPVVQFNLSHTQGLLALAVTVDDAIGVDVESVTRKVSMLALAERFFAASEVAMLQQCAPAELRERFFRLWTLKEAYVKACGLGLQMGLDTFAFSFGTDDVVSLIQGKRQSDEEAMATVNNAWSFLQLAHGDYRLAVALNATGVGLEQLTVLSITEVAEFVVA